MKFGIRELILVSAMIGLLVCSYFFVFAKMNIKAQSLRSDIASKQKAMDDLKQATAGISDVEHKITELQQAIDFFEKKLPAEREVEDILKEISPMAEQNNLTIKTVKPQKTDRGPNYSEEPIQITLSGDFNGYYAFLLQLEKLPRITRVSQMHLEKINERDGEMTAQLTLSIFFEPDPQQAIVQ
jgi:type IV pilus assembly protein PilO